MVKIINLIRYSKRHQLIEKLVNGATVLSTFFDAIQYHNIDNPVEFAENLAQEYGLSENQRKLLRKTAERATKARKIVSEINDKYKPGEKGNLEGRARFYKEVFGENPPSESYGVRSFNFVFGVYLPRSYFKADEEGHGGNSSVSIDDTLDYNIKAVTTCQKTKDLDVLCFKVNHQDTSFAMEYSGKPGETSVERHELKHIIDKLISGRLQNTDELSADLFSGLLTRQSLRMQSATQLEPQIKMLKERYKRYKERKIPQGILKDLEKSIQEKEEISREMKNQKIPSLIADLQTEGMEPRVLSYIATTTPIRKLRRRLESVKVYFKKKMRQAEMTDHFLTESAKNPNKTI